MASFRLTVSLSPLHVSFQRHPTFRSSSAQWWFGRLAVSSPPHHGFRPMRVPSPSLLAASGSLSLSCDWFRSPDPVRLGRLSFRSATPFDQADNRRNGHQFLRDFRTLDRGRFLSSHCPCNLSQRQPTFAPEGPTPAAGRRVGRGLPHHSSRATSLPEGRPAHKCF